MGWWRETSDGKPIELGDEPMDLAHEFLRSFAGPYADELGRKPSTRELRVALANALSTTGRDLYDDLATREVTAVKLATKAAAKIQKFGVGDCFAIPLSSGGFGYGRVIGSDAAGTVIEVFRLRSRYRLPAGRAASSSDLLFQTHVNGRLAFGKARWPIAGRVPLEKKHRPPTFRLGSGYSGWTISRGNKERSATLDEVLTMEPMVCWNAETIERRIESDHPDVFPELEEWQCRDFGDAYLVRMRLPDEIERLYLAQAAVTDAGLKHVAKCVRLKILDLSTRPIGNAGLRHLAKLTMLEELDLGRTQITDAGLVHLRGLKQLKKLRLAGTGCSEREIARLRKSLPKAEAIG